jgi:hypothetical protein
MFDAYQEAMDDEAGAAYGDPRRCPRHPKVITSSNDGLHDAPCGVCEHESEYGTWEVNGHSVTDVVAPNGESYPTCLTCGHADVTGDDPEWTHRCEPKLKFSPVASAFPGDDDLPF